ncbi:tandem-95 repeat protein [Trichlorobacter ammonificans]|uniref:Cadherin domain-containing protein n=1 Tax=Trichlorobacter ammonificans TaxID=2916410 RepID=A0ABM9D645_9BACT|nr:Ig-like domain-containing protein [Trichlorobacter ammonificans]CAH2029841.1 conserved protein of unknown function [Trichlorobacter ammonificans]
MSRRHHRTSMQQPAGSGFAYIMPLEPRIMFDAAAAATADAAADQAQQPTPPPAPSDTAAAHHEVAFIDPTLKDSAALLQGLSGSVEIIALQKGVDPLAHISDYLANHHDITALHLFSHGTPGAVRLGDAVLSADTLADHASQLESWKQSLTADADILLYGCDVAAGSQGEAFISQLALLTGADVAASSDATGGTTAGGNWVLERSTGPIEAAALTAAGYDGLLAATAVNDANSATPRATAEDTPLAVTGISITDADSPANMTVRVQTTGGSSSVTLSGAIVSAGTNGSADFTISGSLAQINATLASLTFTNELNKNSSTSGYSAKIDLTATDVTNGGTGTLSISNISVTAVNDAPDLSTRTNLILNEGGSTAFSLQQLATDANALDVDIQTGQQVLVQQMVQIKSLPSDGTLTYKGGPVVVDTVVPVSELGSLVFTHTGGDLAAPKTVSFTVAVSDGGGAVTNGTLNIVINPVNKAPTISGSPSLYEGQSKAVAPTINLGDTADTLENSTITISDVVTGGQGSFFIDANNNGVMDGGETAFSGGVLTAAQLARFKFIQNGYEPNTPGAVSPSYKITVQDFGGRSDGTGAKLTTETTITLTVLPNNDQPVMDHITPPVDPVDERAYLPITTAMLQVTDPDLNPANPGQAWPAANIVYTIETPPTHGQLLLEVSAGVWKSLDVGGRFTQADIDSGRVRYYQSAELTGEDLIPEKFTFTVRDSAYGYELPTPDDLGTIVPGAVREGDVATGAIKTLEFAFMLQPVDGTGGGTAPTYDGMTYAFDELGTNFNGLASGWKEGNVGSDGIITQAMLEYRITRTIGGTAVVLPPAETVYTLTAPPTNGVIQRDTGSGWQTLDVNATFTQADINNNKIRFVHDGNEDFINSFGFKVSDGTAAGSQDATFNIHVAPVNDRPTGSGGTVNVLEGNGTTVRLGSGMLGMTDVDGTTDTEPNAANTTGNVLWNDEGLADSLWFKILTGPTTNSGSGDVQGKLQYWNGSAWTDITPGAELWLHSSLLTTTADGATSGLRYVHNGTEPLAYAGGPKLTFTYQVRDDLAAPGSAFTTNTSTVTDSGDDQSHASTAITATIGIIPVNNGPQIADKPGDADPDITVIGTITGGGATAGTNEILTDVPEGGTATITSVHLTAVDSDNTTVQRQYRITSAPTLGVLQLNGKTLGIGSTFTQKDIDDGNVKYKHNGEEVGALINGFGAQYHDKFHFVVNDGVLEDAGAGADKNVFLITLKPTNDKPTVAVPSSKDVLGSGSTPVAVTGISVDDPDLAQVIAGSEEDFIRVEVAVLTSGGSAVSGAKLTYTGADPSTGSRAYNNGKDTNTLVIQGTRAEVNTALATLTVAFDNDEDVSSHKIRVTVDDRLYDSGGVLTIGANGGIAATTNSDGSAIDAANNRVSKEITLTASNQNDVPTISNSSSYTVNEDGNVTLNGFSLSDADSFNRNVTVKVELFSDSDRSTPANATTEGKLTYSGLSNVTASGNNSNTVTLTGTLANVQAALNQIKFQGAADYNGTASGDGALYLKTTLTDFGHADQPAGIAVTVDNTITIKPVNDAPVLAVPGNQTMASGTYVDISAGFTVQDTKDINQGATDYIEVTVEALDGTDPYGTLSIATLGSATVDGSGSTITVKGTTAAVSAALNSLRYTPANANVDKVVTIKVTADDKENGKEGTGVGGNTTAVKSFTITISGTNDAPVVTVPDTSITPVSIAEDSSNTVISGISYADTDDFGGIQRITVSVGHGTLNFGTTTGLSLQDGTTYGSATITVEGTKAALNAALATLKYTPTTNYHGSDTLTITANDKGLVGTGGVQTDTKTIAITVTPVNDRPVATTNVTLTTINEDATPAGAAFSGLNFGYGDATDDQTGNGGDDASTAFSYIAIVGNAATAAQGAWQVSSDGGSTWIDIPTSGLGITNALVFRADSQVRFVPAADFNGTPGNLTVRLADGSQILTASTAAGDTKNLNDTANGDADLATGAWNDTNRTIGISVSAVNDAPTRTGAHPTVTVAEDAAHPAGQTVSALFSGNFSDAKDTVAGGSSANSFAGVAITGMVSDKGVWEYSTDNGTTWIAVPADVAAGNAFVLIAADQVRFRPTTADYNGTPADSLTVRLIDTSAGAATSGSRPDLSGAGSGGSTQYSDLANAVILSAVVTPVNDAPTLTAGGQTSGIAVTVTEDNAVTGGGNAFEVALLTNVAVGDIDLGTSGLSSTVFGSGTITVTLTDRIAGDLLTVNGALDGINNVTAYNAGTGQLVITLAQGATTAQVQAILEAVKYSHQSDDPTDKLSGTEKSTRAFTVTLSDGNNLQAGGNAGGPAPLSATVSGTVTITPVNDPPVANNDTTSVTENTDSPTSGNVITGKDRNNTVQPGQNDTDPDTPVADLRVTNIVPPPGGSGGGTITTNPVTVSGKYGELAIHPDGSYSYTLDETNPTVNTLNNGQQLTDEVFTYTLSDGDKTATATLTITINGKTDGAPAITPVDGNGAATGQATVNESGLVVDGDGSETTTGTITVQADAGIKSVTIGGTEITLATLKNLPPDGIAINTPDGRITVSGFTPTSSFGSEVYNGTIAYTYTLEQAQTTPSVGEGTEPISLKVTDKTDVDTTGTLTIRVIDHTPTAVADSNQMSKSVGTVTGNVYSNDAIGADGAALPGPVTAGTTVGSYGTLTLNADGSYTYDIDSANAAVQALTAGSTLTEALTYTITDKDGDTSTAVLTITIIGNTPPIANNDARTTPEDTPVSGNVLDSGGIGDVADSDEDGDTLTVTQIVVDGVTHTVPVDGSPVTATIPGTGVLLFDKTGSYTFTPVADWHGTVPTITYTVDDGAGGTDTAVLTITVTPVADITVDSVVTHVNVPVTTSVLANDSFEGTPVVTVAPGDGPVHGTVTVNPDNTITYTPTPGFFGGDSYTYTVTSGGVTETAVVTVTVANTPPVANDDVRTTLEDTPISGNVLNGSNGDVADSDADSDPLTVTGFTVNGTSYAAGGTADLAGIGSLTLKADGSYTFTPVADWHGTVPVITYTVSDGTGSANGTATATLTITVTPVADITGDSVTTHAGTPVTTPVLANDSFEGTPVVTGTTSPVNGTVTVNPDNTITYTPTPGFSGNDSYTYTVTSGGVTETVTVTVTVTNTPPVAADTAVVVGYNTVRTDRLPVAGDADGDNVTYAKGSDPVHGTVTVDADGSYRYRPSDGYSGRDSFTYTVSDGNGGMNRYTVTITVEPPTVVQTPPVVAPAAPPPAPATPGSFSPVIIAPAATTGPSSTDWAAPPIQNLLDLGEPSYNAMPVLGSSGVVILGGSDSTVGEHGLYLVKTPSSQTILVEEVASFNLPTGTFRHSNAGARVAIEASLADGRPLPGWLSFDPDSGRFTGKPPAGTGGAMDIKVMARDDQGSVAFTQFLLHISEQESKAAHTLKNQGDGETTSAPGVSGTGQGQQTEAGPAGEPAEPATSAGPGVERRQSREHGTSSGRPSLAEQLRQQQPRSRQAELLTSLQQSTATRG